MQEVTPVSTQNDKNQLDVDKPSPIVVLLQGQKFLAAGTRNWRTKEYMYISEQLTGFRQHQAAMNSIANVMTELEHTQTTRQVAALVLLDAVT